MLRGVPATTPQGRFQTLACAASGWTVVSDGRTAQQQLTLNFHNNFPNRFRPYRAQALGYRGRNFDRDWNDRENNRVPMRVDVKRFRLSLMLPNDASSSSQAIDNGIGG